MSPEQGSQLLQYRLLDRLGEGGMGVVWRAVDTTLDREVAIKTLPEEFAADAERLERFEREARLLASLNHPNIAGIYGLHSAAPAGGSESVTRFLAMEYVPGENLATRLAHGPLPIDDAVAIAARIADALEAAHEHGVIHRDLKPANVVVTPSQTVKVLDFGLAKALGQDPTSDPGRLSMSPTVTTARTIAGVILGTAAYMSPEQAKGRPVDRRADVWAFGCVLYEMLTGRRAFDGDTVSETIASVLKDPVAWAALPLATPRTVRDLLERCLDRDPRSRLRDIGEARVLLDRPLDEPADEAVPAPPRRWLLPVVAGAIAIAAAAAVAGWLLRSRPSAHLDFVQVSLPAGTHLALSGIQPGPPAVSPDGRRIVFVAEDADGARNLWVRSLDEPQARMIADTEGASYPFWSPDGDEIAFFASEKLKRVSAAGGSVLTLADAPSGKGGAWNRDGTIVFCPSFNAPLSTVPASGGDAVQLTSLDLAAGETSHRFPQFLKDGIRFIYLARGASNDANRVMLGTLDGGPAREIVRTPANAVVAGDQLIFVRERTLTAQPFDGARGALTGAAVPLAEGIRMIAGAALMVASASPGTVVYQVGDTSQSGQPVVLDRSGAVVAALGEPDDFDDPAVSPDGSRVAIEIASAKLGMADIWILDADTGNRERFTFDESNEFAPVWSPDGRWIAYSSNREGPYQILAKEVGGGAGQKVLVANDDTDIRPNPEDWSATGNTLIYVTETPSGGATSIWSVSADGDEPPRHLADSSFRDPQPRVSPDGRWMAFGTGIDTGSPTIVAVDYPDARRRWQVAKGSQAFWSRDGRELLFLGTDGWLSSIELRPRPDAFEWTPPKPLFRTNDRYIVSAGDGFLALRDITTNDVASQRLEVILDWESLLTHR